MVRVPVGHSRTAKLIFHGTQSNVEQFQGSPSYTGSGEACRVHSTIVDTFGQPPYGDS
jgi:hypothetical protein